MLSDDSSNNSGTCFVYTSFLSRYLAYVTPPCDMYRSRTSSAVSGHAGVLGVLRRRALRLRLEDGKLRGMVPT